MLLERRTAPGDGARTRVLLLHGMANNGNIWDRLCALAPQREALRQAELWSAELPWRGNGPTDWSHRADTTAWLAETLDTLTATAGPADVVVGHSYSATMLLDLLAGQPPPGTPAALERHGIGGLVFVSPFFRPRPADFDWDTMAGLVEKFVLAMEEGIRVCGGARGHPDLYRAMAQRVCETIGPYGWSRFFELYLRTPWMRTAALRAPSLVVSGTEDRIAVHTEAVALAERIPSATLRAIEGSGHFPMIDCAARFADALDEFLGTGIAGRPEDDHETARDLPLSAPEADVPGSLVERT